VAIDAHIRALQRFTDFAAKGIVPQDLALPEPPPDNSSRV
jgi:hypothetical protein